MHVFDSVEMTVLWAAVILARQARLGALFCCRSAAMQMLEFRQNANSLLIHLPGSTLSAGSV